MNDASPVNRMKKPAPPVFFMGESTRSTQLD